MTKMTLADHQVCQEHGRWTLVVTAWSNIPKGTGQLISVEQSSVVSVANPLWCSRAGGASVRGVMLTAGKTMAAFLIPPLTANTNGVIEAL